MESPTTRNRRSELLTKDEHKAFVKLYHSFPTKTDAQEIIGIKRQVLDLVAIKGKGSPETIQKVRSALVSAA